jgi:AraC-like DNA-binding protein
MGTISFTQTWQETKHGKIAQSKLNMVHSSAASAAAQISFVIISRSLISGPLRSHSNAGEERRWCEFKDIAESLELSKAHFSQTCRKSTGQSPHQFVLHRRVQCAKEMLSSGETRVLDVAVACGVKSQQPLRGSSRMRNQSLRISPRISTLED